MVIEMDNLTAPVVSSGVASTNYVYIAFLLTVSIPVITVTILGNLMVILSWILYRSVRNPHNAYFVSLAVADFLVGVFVFPLTISYGYNKGWVHGLTTCQIWLVGYFSLCPISAYHLVLIAVDRYRMVTEGISYLQRISMKNVLESLVIVWLLGLWVVLPMVLNWTDLSTDPQAEKQCITKKLPHWVVHISITSLGLPMYLLSRLYWKVFHEIKQRLKLKGQRSNIPPTASDQSGKMSSGSTVNTDFEEIEDTDSKAGNVSRHESMDVKKGISQDEKREKDSSQTLDRERKAAVTLGIIIGAFFTCWLPWYTLSVYDMLVSHEWKPHSYFFSWSAILGYSNSCINPIIYAFRNPDFRDSFLRIVWWFRPTR